MTPQIITTSLVLAALVAAPLAVSAQDEAPADPAALEARRVFSEGRAHEAAQRYALAAERYQQAHEIMRRAALERAAVALFWAGRALYHVPGRERDARETFQSFLDSSTLLTEDEQVRDWRSEALERIAELDARIGPESSAQPEGAHALSPPDSEAVQTEPSSSDDRTATPPGSTISPVGPIVLGVGGAILISGLVTVGIAFGQDQDLVTRCPSRMGCDEAMRSAVEATRNLGLAGDVLWIAGATIAVAGLVLTLTLTEESDEDEGALEVEGVAGGAVASLRWSVR